MGLFSDALTIAAGRIRSRVGDASGHGMADRILGCVRQARAPRRLLVLEKVSLAPRQTIALIEVDGQKLLVASTQEGSPSFCLLNSSARRSELRPWYEIPIEGRLA